MRGFFSVYFPFSIVLFIFLSLWVRIAIELVYLTVEQMVVVWFHLFALYLFTWSLFLIQVFADFYFVLCISIFKNIDKWQIEAVYSGGRAQTGDLQNLDEFGNMFCDMTEYSLRKYSQYPLNSNMTFKIVSDFCNTSIVQINNW